METYMNYGKGDGGNDIFYDALKQLKYRALDDSYAQALYASMCNMMWRPKRTLTNPFPKTYSCTWRYAGGLVAELRDKGENYMNFYCSGYGKDSMPEGSVRKDIEHDFKILGWVKKEYPPDWLFRIKNKFRSFRFKYGIITKEERKFKDAMEELKQKINEREVEVNENKIKIW